MLANIAGAMAKIVSSVSTAISVPIVYNHRRNGGTYSISKVNATVESLDNYKLDGDIIASGKRFIISKDDDGKFLNRTSIRNDTVEHGGDTWYVATSNDSDVDLVVIASKEVFSLKTKKVR